MNLNIQYSMYYKYSIEIINLKYVYKLIIANITNIFIELAFLHQ